MTSPGLNIEELIEGLARPGALPGCGDGLTQVVQTHISVVFLTREHAFKLKKAVDFGFLNFSTGDRRAHFCREELRLNRRLAPAVYLGLAPVWRRGPGRFEVGSASDNPPPADELLVVMKRLPQERMLDRLLAEDQVSAADIERLARLMAAFHGRAVRGPAVDGWGSREAVGRLALENFDQTERFVGELVAPEVHRRLRSRTAGFLRSRERLFAARVRAGRVVDGHGDLHSPNICLLADGQAVVYDCIEFAPAYRCGDAASEVAFLAMDLEFRGRQDLADAFVATYAREAEDPTLAAMLPFYGSYRAMVRAKVAALTGSAPEVGPAERQRHGAAARRLFALADKFSRGLTPRALIALGGLTGVGKTVVAHELRRAAGLQPLETDRIRKELAGLDPERPARAPVGQGIYTPALTEATYRALVREARLRLEEGESALAVGTFVTRRQREGVRALAREVGAPLLFVRLTAPAALVLARIARRAPGLSDGDAHVYEALAASDEPADELAPGERLDLDAADLTPEALAEQILARVRRPFEEADARCDG